MPPKIKNFHFWLLIEKLILNLGIQTSGGTSQVPGRYASCLGDSANLELWCNKLTLTN